MILDDYCVPIFDENDIFDILYNGDGHLLNKLTVVDNIELTQFKQTSGIELSNQCNYDNTMVEFDAEQQSDWFIPIAYRNIDVLHYCLEKCTTDAQIERVCNEYLEYDKRGLTKLLQWAIYFVDNCIQHNIVWGVGRGSSVASYILFLIGVHRIDSMQYNLDLHEFFR